MTTDMDHRDLAGTGARKWFKEFNENTMTAIFENEETGTLESIQCNFIVCKTCDGRGSHVNPSIDHQGIFFEEFEEDPDFKEAYFSGAYDVPCYECKGKRVVPYPIAVSDAVMIEKELEENALCAEEYAMEQRMGC